MSNSEGARVNEGGANGAGPADVQSYIAAVDNLLLDLPWQRRRELINDLRDHLRENPDQLTLEPPDEYAAELRASSEIAAGGLLLGLRSISWPTPLEWWESVLRGSAIVLVVLVVYDFLAAASQAVVGDPSPVSWLAMIDSALQSVYPTPAFHGSQRNGLLIYLPVMVVVGQLTTAALLSRAPHRRPRLRLLTYASLAAIILLLGYGALRSFG